MTHTDALKHLHIVQVVTGMIATVHSCANCHLMLCSSLVADLHFDAMLHKHSDVVTACVISQSTVLHVKRHDNCAKIHHTCVAISLTSA
jgi:hypothetical protein